MESLMKALASSVTCVFVVLAASLGCGLTSTSSPDPGEAERAAAGGQLAARSAFDRLDPADIPFAKRPPNQPKELVAVFGSPGDPASNYLAVSRDGRWIAVSDVKAAVRLYDTSTWKEAGAAKGSTLAF